MQPGEYIYIFLFMKCIWDQNNMQWEILLDMSIIFSARNTNIISFIYSKSMKTQHLYFRYLSNMDFSIKFLF